MLNPTQSFTINPNPGSGELTVLFAGHSQTVPLHMVGPRVLDHHLIFLVLSGNGTYQCYGHEYSFGQGDCFFIFPGELTYHCSDENKPWMYLWIGFTGTHADQLLGRMGISVQRPFTRVANFRRLAFMFHQVEQAFKKGNAGCDLNANGLMRIILSEFILDSEPQEDVNNKPKPEIERQVEHAIRWLTLQYAQPVSIRQMSQELGYTRTYLSKMFKLHTGMTPMNFLNTIRMERAKHLLHEALTVEQVAASVGFNDSLYFSRQFKKWTGSSPTEYRAVQQRK